MVASSGMRETASRLQGDSFDPFLVGTGWVGGGTMPLELSATLSVSRANRHPV